MKKNNLRLIIFIFLTMIFVDSVFGVDNYPNDNVKENDMGVCSGKKFYKKISNKFYFDTSANIGKVKEKVYLKKNIGNRLITTNSYLITDDIALIFDSKDNFYCIGFGKTNNPEKFSFGWVEQNYIDVYHKYPKVDLNSLIGSWETNDGVISKGIVITKSKDKYFLNGGSHFEINNRYFMRTYETYGEISWLDDNVLLTTDGSEGNYIKCRYEIFKYYHFLIAYDYNDCISSNEYTLTGIYSKITDEDNK